MPWKEDFMGVAQLIYCHIKCSFLIKPTGPTNFPNFIFSKNSYIFRAFPLPIIRSFLLYIRHWYISCGFDDIFQAVSGQVLIWPDPAWKLLSNLQEIYQCRIYSRNLLMMDKRNARNIKIFFKNKIWEIRGSCWFY